MAKVLFKNVSVLDCTGAPPFAGQVLVEGNRIKAVAPQGTPIASDGAQVVDGGRDRELRRALRRGVFRRREETTEPRACCEEIEVRRRDRRDEAGGERTEAGGRTDIEYQLDWQQRNDSERNCTR